jgi:hypothetical protein
MLWLLGLAASAADLGVGLVGAFDLPSAAYEGEATTFQPGFGLQVPLRLSLGESAWLRISGQWSALPGHDEVRWTESGEEVTWVSNDHPSWRLAGELRLGPGLYFKGPARLRPYIGSAVGAARVTERHDFGGQTAPLLGGGSPDPISRGWAPLIGLDAGLRWKGGQAFAIDAGAGYTVAFHPEAPLLQTPSGVQATRSAYGLDLIQIGAAVVFEFGS